MTRLSKKNYFLTLEGIEGVGKSTHLRYIQQYFAEANIPIKVTREPGGTPLAEAIRQLLLEPRQEKVAHQTELLLLFAGRSQHVHQVILPALQQGQWVICDRFTDATYAYQGYGRGISLEEIAALEQWVQADLRPDVTLLLDAPVTVAFKRTQKRLPDRIESEHIGFFERVREGYLALAQQFPARYHIVNAAASLIEVRSQIKNILDTLTHTRGIHE
jgi:dTMP kinase